MTPAHTIGILGASGGVGCSVLAVAVAHRAALAGARAVCVDGRPGAGGLDVVAGLESDRGRRWSDIAGARGRLDGRDLIARLPGRAGMSVLSFDRAAQELPDDEAVTAALDALRREVAVVVIDLPCRCGRRMPALFDAVDDGVLLVGSSPPALSAAAAAVPALPDGIDRWWLAQRVDRSGTGLADTVAAGLELPLLVEVPRDPLVDADLAGGVLPGGRGRLGRSARHIVESLGERTRRSA